MVTYQMFTSFWCFAVALVLMIKECQLKILDTSNHIIFTVVIETVCGTEDITFFPFYSAVFSSDDFQFKSRWF